MSFFGKLFGGKKEEAPSTSDAIQKLRETQDLLTKKQEYLEKQIDDCLLTARKNASKNKRRKSTAQKTLKIPTRICPNHQITEMIITVSHLQFFLCSCFASSEEEETTGKDLTTS